MHADDSVLAADVSRLVADDDLSVPTDRQALERLLQDSSRVSCSNLPATPSAYLQLPRASDRPLVLYLCRLWQEAGLTDKEWSQALSTFGKQLGEQPRQQASGRTGGGGGGSTPGGGGGAQGEGKWTLETFSMWRLRRGGVFRQCQQWFRGYDFDQDGLISVSDFVQGLVAATASQVSNASSPLGLCTALSLYRMLDLDKQRTIPEPEAFEKLLEESQISLTPEQQLSSYQIAQRAVNFDVFRVSLVPRLQGAAANRLDLFTDN